jgi:CBS domain-containing protein
MDKKPTLMAVMTPFPYSVKLDSLFSYAKNLMQQHKVNHLPVMEGAEIIGVITSRDLRSRKKLQLNNEDKSKLRVKDAYISVPYVVDIHQPLEDVLLTMANKHHNSALVTKNKKLVGIFTYIDVCRYFGEYLKNKYSSPENNDAA